jgi:hypothetical protein
MCVCVCVCVSEREKESNEIISYAEIVWDGVRITHMYGSHR